VHDLRAQFAQRRPGRVREAVDLAEQDTPPVLGTDGTGHRAQPAHLPYVPHQPPVRRGMIVIAQRPAEEREVAADLLPQRAGAADDPERVAGQERDDADDPALERPGPGRQVVRAVRRRPQSRHRQLRRGQLEMAQQPGLEAHRLFGLARLGQLDQERGPGRGVDAEGLVDLALQPADRPPQAVLPRDDAGHRLLGTELG
jgi:hypothetical protein